MSEQDEPDPQPDPDDEQPDWPPPGEQAALEPEDEISHPLRAQDAFVFLPKVIG